MAERCFPQWRLFSEFRAAASFLFDSKGKAGGDIGTDKERERGKKERKQGDDKGSWILL